MRGLHWFRNDLRLQDNRALGDLFQAVDEWCGLFVLEPRLVNKPSVSRKRLSFLFGCLDDLASDIAEVGSRLVIVEGPAETQIPQVMHELSISVLSFNEGTTPFARSRDQSVIRSVEKAGHQAVSYTHLRAHETVRDSCLLCVYALSERLVEKVLPKRPW